MGMMFFGVSVGPLIGPNIGGALTFYWNWRATFYFCVAYSGLVCSAMALITVETYRPASFDSLSSGVELSSIHSEIEDETEEDETMKIKNFSISEERDDGNEDDSTNDENTNSTNYDKDKLISKSSTSPSSPSTLSPSSSFNPLRALFFLQHPFVALTSISVGVAFGIMFTIETILPDLFDEAYHLNSLQVYFFLFLSQYYYYYFWKANVQK